MCDLQYIEIPRVFWHGHGGLSVSRPGFWREFARDGAVLPVCLAKYIRIRVTSHVLRPLVGTVVFPNVRHFLRDQSHWTYLDPVQPGAFRW